MENEILERNEERGIGPSADEKSWAMGCHLIALVTGFVGPLILWLIKREGNSYVDQQGKEALNFQLSILMYFVVCSIFSVVVIGIALMPLVWIVNVIFIIIAAVKANDGENYRYPLCIRFIK